MSKVLTHEFGHIVMNQGAPNVWTIDYSNTFGDWRQPTPNAGFALCTGYIDLAGMSQQDKTLYFKGATVQETLNPVVFAQAPGDSIIVVDIMSSIPLTDAEYNLVASTGNLLARFGQSGLTFDQTIYMRIRQYVVDVDTAAWGSMVLVSENQLGSLNATASDRIYTCRQVLIGLPFTGNRVDLSAARYVVSAEAKEEPEYEYLMRLKRSYELQNEPDRDF